MSERATRPPTSAISSAGETNRVWLVVDRHRRGPMTFEDALTRLSGLRRAGVELHRMTVTDARRCRSTANGTVDIRTDGRVVRCGPMGDVLD